VKGKKMVTLTDKEREGDGAEKVQACVDRKGQEIKIYKKA